jgi:hypothetical protein
MHAHYISLATLRTAIRPFTASKRTSRRGGCTVAPLRLPTRRREKVFEEGTDARPTRAPRRNIAIRQPVSRPSSSSSSSSSAAATATATAAAATTTSTAAATTAAATTAATSTAAPPRPGAGSDSSDEGPPPPTGKKKLKIAEVGRSRSASRRLVGRRVAPLLSDLCHVQSPATQTRFPRLPLARPSAPQEPGTRRDGPRRVETGRDERRVPGEFPSTLHQPRPTIPSSNAPQSDYPSDVRNYVEASPGTKSHLPFQRHQSMRSIIRSSAPTPSKLTTPTPSICLPYVALPSINVLKAAADISLLPSLLAIQCFGSANATACQFVYAHCAYTHLHAPVCKNYFFLLLLELHFAMQQVTRTISVLANVTSTF